MCAKGNTARRSEISSGGIVLCYSIVSLVIDLEIRREMPCVF